MLNETSLKKLTTAELKFFCKNAKIKYSKLKKIQLFEEYSKYLACKLIQKKYREHFYRNTTDCITLEPVHYPCFIYRSKFGKHFCYNYESIIKYIMKTGDTRDPMTRENYTDDDLARLDLSVKYYFKNIRYSSTLKIKKNMNYARKIRNRENEILSFQTRMDELKSIVITFITEGIIFWNLHEPMVIDNIEYISVNSYINTILHELKMVFINVKNYDPFTANCFKTSLTEELQQFNTSPQIKQIYDIIVLF